MFLSKLLLGEDQSKQFLKELPKISKKETVKLTIKVAFLTFLFINITYLIVDGVSSFFKLNFSEIIIMIASTLICYPFIFWWIYPYFFTWEEVKKQYRLFPFLPFLRDFLVLLVIDFLLLYLFIIADYFVSPDHLREGREMWREIFSGVSNTPPLTSNPVLDVILSLTVFSLVGLTEELVFKGGIYRLLRTKFKKLTALVTYSAIFTLFHFSDLKSFFSFPILALFLSSVISGYYYERRNNLLPNTLVHAVHDFIGAGLILLAAVYTFDSLHIY